MKFLKAVTMVLMAAPFVAFGATNTFPRVLYVGMKGEDVRTLQKILNTDVATLIATSGPGSLGNETDYFGEGTRKAVIRFQEKYRNEILTPAGLSKGSGMFGEKTRAKALKLLIAQATLKAKNAQPSATASSTPVNFTENPNLKNIDQYIAAVRRSGVKRGTPADTLAFIENKIRKGAATSIDFKKVFFENQKAAYLKKHPGGKYPSPITAFFEKLLTAIGGSLFAQKVYAGLGLPFGGYITYVNPVICDCPPGVITQIFVALPAQNNTSNLLLNYVNESEGFQYYNIPEPSIAVLGLYEPGIPSCWTYAGTTCVLVESEGQILPIVGSSLVP